MIQLTKKCSISHRLSNFQLIIWTWVVILRADVFGVVKFIQIIRINQVIYLFVHVTFAKTEIMDRISYVMLLGRE